MYAGRSTQWGTGIFLALLALPAIVYAAPTITNVSGTLTHGSMVTVSGSGFGIKSQAAPNLWDTADNQSSYSTLSNGDAIPTGGAHPYDDAGAAANTNSTLCTVTGEQRSSRSVRNYKMTNSIKNSLSRIWHGVSGNRLYVSWWFKSDTDLSDPQSEQSSKYLRTTAAVGDFSNHTFSWTQHQNYVYDTDSSCPGFICANNWDWYAPPVNEWVLYEALFNTEDFSYVLKTDNQMLTSSSYAPATTDFAAMWIVGYDGGGVAPLPITSWIDDVYIDGTEQRVVLGNAATYAASTHLELQPPISWAADSVSATLNQGSFSDGANAYLYIVDSTGAVNATGYPVTVGDTPDTTQPAAPSGLGVQ